jgi:hypothetical protein
MKNPRILTDGNLHDCPFKPSHPTVSLKGNDTRPVGRWKRQPSHFMERGEGQPQKETVRGTAVKG